MRLLGRPALPLLAGLALAAIIAALALFPDWFERVQEMDRQAGFPALAALAVLAAAVLLSAQMARHARQERALVADVVRRESARRVADTQRLTSLGQAVARALDHEAMRTALNQNLPRITGTAETWVLARQGPGWVLLAGPPAPDTTVESNRVRLAEEAVRGVRAGEIRDNRPVFPVSVGGSAVGVIGIEPGTIIDEERGRMIEAAAALIAAALHNIQHFRNVRETGIRDGLTGCWTRTHAMEVLDSELRRSRRTRLPVSIILFDLDHFKSINDRYGHLCGDAVLAEVGRRFHEVLRSSDLKCRYGGEEFLGVLCETPLHGAGAVAEELRRAISSQPILWSNERLTVTASLGVTQAESGELDIDAIIGRADSALYRAKQQGRNRVLFEPEVPPVPQGRAETEAPKTATGASRDAASPRNS
jgi:diguanylate cyclase (GGDEF)-like protein